MSQSKKTVSNDGKKDRRISRAQARNRFDRAMNKIFAFAKIITKQTLDSAMSLAEFNIRRFAHWTKRRKLLIDKGLISFINKQFGSLGGLPMSQFS